MSWWLWTMAGCVLLALELTSPGFFILFFGVGALVVAGAVALWPALDLWAQIALFSITSLGALLLFRKRLASVFAREPAPSSNDLLRDTATPLEGIAPGAVGKAELRGAHWKARNVADVPLASGQRCRVVATEELMLHLVPE